MTVGRTPPGLPPRCPWDQPTLLVTFHHQQHLPEKALGYVIAAVFPARADSMTNTTPVAITRC